MDQQTTVTTTQHFLLFGCHSEWYSINLSENLLSPDNKYTVRYTYPDNSAKSVVAEFVRGNQLLVKNPPDFEHPCTVRVEVCANGSKQCLEKFSLDLVSPVEYLFRKYSRNDNEMSSSDKMTNALLAMSLSYYYVMEEQMKMEKKADKMLSTLLTCHGNNVPPKHITSVQSATHNDNIKEFAERHQLQCTLQCLPDPLSTYDVPSKQPKFNGESKTITESLATNVPQEHYTPLVRNTRDRCQSEYALLTNESDYIMMPIINGGQTTETTAGIYEIPNNGNLLNDSQFIFLPRRPAAVQPPQPYARRRVKSLESILDDADYTYVDTDDMQSKSLAITLPRCRPPRPPPPRKPVSPNKPPVLQRTVPPSSPLLEKKMTPLCPRNSTPIPSTPVMEKKVISLDPRNSSPIPPTPKQRTTNWYKDKS